MPSLTVSNQDIMSAILFAQTIQISQFKEFRFSINFMAYLKTKNVTLKKYEKMKLMTEISTIKAKVKIIESNPSDIRNGNWAIQILRESSERRLCD